jgi:hypothetical protein
MKKLMLLLFALSGMLYTFSQDSIFLVNNNIIAAKITDINSEEVTFKKINNFDGPNYHEKKKNILHIRYSNGDIEFYEESENFGAGKLAEHGVPATIILISGKVIPCEIMDISNLCVIYKEKSTDENTLVVMKSFVDTIWKKDSSFSTFSKEGQEFLHAKPVPKPEAPKEAPVAKTEGDKKTNTSLPETKPKEEGPKSTSTSDKTKTTLKGDCELLDKDGNLIKTKDVIVDTKNRRISYVDQYNKIVTKLFGDIVMIYYKRGNNNRTPLDLTGQFDIDDLEQK